MPNSKRKASKTKKNKQPELVQTVSSPETVSNKKFLYHPPANVRDFKQQSSYEKWSDWIKTVCEDCITGEGYFDKPMGSVHWNPEKNIPQFYVEANRPNPPPIAERMVTWNGFPERLFQENPGDIERAYQIADKQPERGQGQDLARVQDEYLEWFVHKKDGKIVAIDFTCEGPEYWESMYEWEPQTCLELYRKYVSKDVQLEDLGITVDGETQYNYYNKWNTTHGIMHLNCPPNSLGAEIYLAASSTVLRKTPEGKLINTDDRLIRCALFGGKYRNSDPNVGLTVNQLSQVKLEMTLKNPIGLYIHSSDLSGLSLKSGNKFQLSDVWKLVRGQEGKALRYRLEAPEGDEFLIGGAPLKYGGQIASLITMQLTGIARPCEALQDKDILSNAVYCEDYKPPHEAHGISLMSLPAKKAKKSKIKTSTRI